MNAKTYTTLPQEAKDIRIKVFMKEQGFENEFDDIDQISSHIVVFDETKPVGTCRFFKENNHYTIGRVAVLKEYRNKHIGHLLLESAEKEIKWRFNCSTRPSSCQFILRKPRLYSIWSNRR